MAFLSVKDVWGSIVWEQVNPHTIRFWYRCYIDTDCIFQPSHQISPKLRSCIAQGVLTCHKKFQINACTKQVLLQRC